MTTAKRSSYNRLKQTAIPSKVSAQKAYDYIKKIEVDGLPRVRAYAEAIDPGIYDLTPQQISHKLDYFKANYKGYDELKEMILAEQRDWSLRRSVALQDKAVNLLSNLLDRANDIANNPDTDAKELNTAINTLKTIMPALTAPQSREESAQTDKKKRAAGFIN